MDKNARSEAVINSRNNEKETLNNLEYNILMPDN